MPRQPDPDLEDRILKAARALWKRGGDSALTMRAVAQAARTNTPAVYRRFRDRDALVRALLLRIAEEIRVHFVQGGTLEAMAEAYIDFALKLPHEYELFYTYSKALTPRKSEARPMRESRPNFALVEKLLAARLGGQPEDHTQMTFAIWALLHGASMMLLSKSIPEEHMAELRRACRTAVKTMLDHPQGFSTSG